MNFSRKEIISNFTIGFIPILVFIIAELVYGVIIGIIIALVFGLLELLFFYIRDRKFEKFIVFDIGLLVVFGLVSILLENPFFFKLKPALLEFILVVVLAIHGFTEKPLLFMIGKRYMRNMTILPAQEMMMRMITRILAVILFIHVLLIVWSAQYWSEEAWAFISGGLFYVIMGLMVFGQWLYVFFKKKKMPAQIHKTNLDEEWFDIVDEAGKIIGKAPRSHVHGNPDLIHPTVHIQIFNKQGRLYLQKRSASKDLYPGYWDTAVGGHVSSGENVQSAMLREAKEELGIEAQKAQPLFRYVMRNKWESEMIHSFKLVMNGPFKINKDEIDEGRFWTIFEIRKSLGQNIFTPNFEEEFRMMENLKVI